MKYLKHLTPVSIIIINHNEYPSTFKRTLHSVTNRTPPELIHEIVIIDDASTREQYHKEIPEYIRKNFPKARIVRLPEQKGLIFARNEGARQATGEILVYIDAHCEVNVNWLPPLLGKNAVRILKIIFIVLFFNLFRTSHDRAEDSNNANN
jgi:polypeptide N-acetylgalactosaminyltransferase